MAIYMKYGDIKGGITATEHEDWLELGSCQWGTGRSFSTPIGSTENREGSQANFSEVVVTRTQDNAEAKLLHEALFGKGKDVTIHFTTSENPPKTYLEYKLENTVISGYSLSSGGDRPSVSLSLNCTKFTQKLVPTGKDLANTDPEITFFDLTTGKGG